MNDEGKEGAEVSSVLPRNITFIHDGVSYFRVSCLSDFFRSMAICAAYQIITFFFFSKGKTRNKTMNSAWRLQVTCVLVTSAERDWKDCN